METLAGESKMDPSYIGGSFSLQVNLTTISRSPQSQDCGHHKILPFFVLQLISYLVFFFFFLFLNPHFCYPCASFSPPRLLPIKQPMHRITPSGWGGNLWRWCSPAFCSEHSHKKKVAQSHVQSGFDYLHGWRLHNLSGQLIPVFDHP